jgi:Protein of unknown function (DUF664)
MIWVAPPIERPDEPFAGDEWSMVMGRLERNRSTLLHKCTGLTGEQLALRSAPPSTMSLLGLVRHLSNVERRWLVRGFLGDVHASPVYGHDGVRDVDFDETDPGRAEADVAALLAEQERSRAAVRGASLDDTFEDPKWGTMTLRWVIGHLTEEYARHCGHADLLREGIDGLTGP